MTRPLSHRIRRPLAAALAAVMLLASGCSRDNDPAAWGTRVKGTTVTSSAPLIGSGDSYDVLGAPNTDAGVRSYAIERGADKEGVFVSVSTEPQKGAADSIQVDLKTPSGGTCGSFPADSSADVSSALLSGLVASFEGDGYQECLESKRLILTVRRTAKEATEWLNLHIRVTHAATGDVTKFPEPPPTPIDLKDLSFGAAEEKKGGEWISDALKLEPGHSITSSVGLGTLHTFTVPVRWGQGLQVNVMFPEAAPSAKPKVKDAQVQGQVMVLSPFGDVVARENTYLSSERTRPVTIAPAGLNQSTLLPQGNYTVIVTAVSRKATDVTIPYTVTARTYGDVNDALGPDMPMDANKEDSVPAFLLWLMLVAGVTMIVAGMAQVAMHRQRY